MFGLRNRPRPGPTPAPAPDPTTAAAQTLSQRSAEVRADRARSQREKVRQMANRLRAALRDKNLADLPDIDWSNFS